MPVHARAARAWAPCCLSFIERVAGPCVPRGVLPARHGRDRPSQASRECARVGKSARRHVRDVKIWVWTGASTRLLLCKTCRAVPVAAGAPASRVRGNARGQAGGHTELVPAAHANNSALTIGNPQGGRALLRAVLSAALRAAALRVFCRHRLRCQKSPARIRARVHVHSACLALLRHGVRSDGLALGAAWPRSELASTADSPSRPQPHTQQGSCRRAGVRGSRDAHRAADSYLTPLSSESLLACLLSPWSPATRHRTGPLPPRGGRCDDR